MLFWDDICCCVIVLFDLSDDEIIVGVVEFFIEFWRVGAATEEEFLFGIFCEGLFDEFVCVEIVFNVLLWFGDVLWDVEFVRVYVVACAFDGRRNLSARGAAVRLIFFVEEVYVFVESGYLVVNWCYFGVWFVILRVDVYDFVWEELKFLRIVYDDGGAETAAILCGECKGWVFWYVGLFVCLYVFDGLCVFCFVVEDLCWFVLV